jgi:oxygen-independent coproporphyrinogen III oxidase
MSVYCCHVSSAEMSNTRFDAELIRRYDLNIPPYTSYPTPPHFHRDFDVLAYRRAALLSNAGLGCFEAEIRLPSRLGGTQQQYLHCLHREIELQSELFDPRRPITHLYISGDATALADMAAVQQLLEQFERHLQRTANGGLSIDFDPCTATAPLIRQFAALGFTCANFSIPGYTASLDRALELTEIARRSGFQALSFDLIYGLPLQSTQEFSRQLQLVVGAKPERLSTYMYPYLPELQRASHPVRHSRRPSAATRLGLRQLTIDVLTQAGYMDLGMDRFALADAPSAPGSGDILGIGLGAVSRMGTAYAQNAKQLTLYCAALERHVLPIACGVELTVDDVVRREVIQQIMCRRSLDFDAIGSRYALDFHSYFARELMQLRTLADDGLVVDSDTGFAVSARGHLLLQNITTVFDAYRHPVT